jgi:hypothetical protein
MVGVGVYVVTVLVPGLAVMLIKEDMKVCDDETARQILQKSTGLPRPLMLSNESIGSHGSHARSS